MKKLNVTILFVILFNMLVFIQPMQVFATVDSPDIEFQINSVRAYGNALQNGDELYLVDYSISYTATPSGYTATDLFICRAYYGSHYLGANTPYSYGSINDYGFNRGVISIYVEPEDVEYFESKGWPVNSNLTFEIVGNPLISWTAGTPPSVSFAGPSSSYDGNINADGVDTQVRTAISIYTNYLEDDWNLPPGTLIDKTDGAVLTSYGEEYFSGAIPNIQKISPSLFNTSSNEIYWKDDPIIVEFCSGSMTDYTASSKVYNGLNRRYGEFYQASSNYTLKSISLFGKKVGNGCGDVRIDVWNADSSGSPVGASLCHGVLDSSTFSGTYNAWLTWEMGTPSSITMGNNYSFLASSSTGNATNYALFKTLTNSYWYSNGKWLYGNADGSTGVNSTLDIIFMMRRSLESTLSDELMSDQKIHGMFDTDSAGDLFNVSGVLISSIIGLALIIVLAITMRNQSGGYTGGLFLACGVVIFAFGVFGLIPMEIWMSLMAVVGFATIYMVWQRVSSS